MIAEKLVLLKNIRQSGYKGGLAEYEQAGGYKAWREVLSAEWSPADILENVKNSGLRGRLVEFFCAF